MKSIWIIVSWDPRKNKWGVEKVMDEVKKKLIKRYKISYVFPSKNNFIEKDWDIEYHGIKCMFRAPFDWIILSSKLWKFRFDLIIDNLWITKLFNNIYSETKVIIVCHAVVWSALTHIKFWNLFLQVWYFMYYFIVHMMWKITCRRADVVIAPQKNAGKEISNYYKVKNDRFINIYNGVDVISYDIKPFTGELDIIFISNNHIWKWVEMLEEIAKKLKEYKVMFYIIWAPYHNKYNLKNIISLWILLWEDKYKKIKDSDIVFMASKFEWQNLSVIEAMSKGCIPLISLNTHVDVVEWTELEFFVSKDNNIDFYVNRIMYLLNNPNKIDYFKKLSVKTVSNILWEKQAWKYLEVVDNLLL